MRMIIIRNINLPSIARLLSCVDVDENKDKRIEKSITQPKEHRVMEDVWKGFNVKLKFV